MKWKFAELWKLCLNDDFQSPATRLRFLEPEAKQNRGTGGKAGVVTMSKKEKSDFARKRKELDKMWLHWKCSKSNFKASPRSDKTLHLAPRGRYERKKKWKVNFGHLHWFFRLCYEMETCRALEVVGACRFSGSSDEVKAVKKEGKGSERFVLGNG